MLEIERREMHCTTLLPPGLICDEDEDKDVHIIEDGDEEGDNIDNDEDFVTDNTR